ncbi:MAG: tetratricopeptide repeat protein [Chitinophagales bacterium]|nr:tetratricopeptide repeat protein [Chitinophagales bacterium]
MDNLGLDTTAATMQLFADAELLHLQNKDAEANKLLNEILTKYPEHALIDDVYYKQAQIALNNKKYDEALNNLKKIETNYADGILADNAIFMIGDIYENYLKDENKAMEYYKKIITDHTDSVLLVEARKRYRTLRGDEL